MKINFTEKLFYEKFPYRVTLNINESQQFIWHNFLYNQEIEYKQVKVWGYEGFFRYYLIDLQQLNFVKNNLSNAIIDICEPLNELHKNDLKDNSKIRLRSTLFFNKYRALIVFKPTILTQDPSLRQWFKDVLIRNNLVEKQDYRFTERYHPSLYLSKLDIITILRLSFNEFIKRIEIIKLPNEY